MLDSNVGPAVGARAVVGIRIQRELDERRVRQATRWYRNRGSRLLRDLPESEWERVLGELGVDASSAEWTGEGGRRRLEVTEAFVRGVAAWQVGQRLGMEVDGVLGPTSMARLGIAVGRGDVTLNVADLQQGTADPALADFLDETTFAARLLDLVTGGGTSARTSDLRGRGETTVGLSGVVEGLEITPRSLLERLHGDHPDLVVGSFFTPPEGHDLDDVLAALGLAAGPAPIHQLASRPALEQLRALLVAPEAVRTQLTLFQEQGVNAAALLAGNLTPGTAAGPSFGAVALTALAGSVRASSGAIAATPAAQHEVQLELAREYARRVSPGDAADGAEEFVVRLFAHHFDGADRPAWGDVARDVAGGSDEGAGAAPDTVPKPSAIGGLERVLQEFAPIWDEPYDPEADVAAAIVAAGGPSVAPVPDTEAELEPIRESMAEAAASTPWPHEEIYDAWVAEHGVPIAGMAESWEGFLAQMREMDWMGRRVIGHELFLQRLHQAEQYLHTRHPDLADDELVGRVSAVGRRGQWRAAERGTSYHVFGMAIDIGPNNPWIANPAHADRRHEDHWVIWRAVWLAGDGAAPVWPADSAQRARDDDTETLWGHFDASSRAVTRYFELLGDPEGLQQRVAGLGARPDQPADRRGRVYPYSPEAHPIEDLAAGDAARWRQVIEADRDIVSSRGGLSPTTGFMNLRLELVQAMRDHAGLGWGACDFGPNVSGDFMHFDLRNGAFERLRSAIRDR